MELDLKTSNIPELKELVIDVKEKAEQLEQAITRLEDFELKLSE